MYTTASTPDLGPPSLLSKILGDLTPEVKRLGHEAEHSPPSSAEVKNAITPLPQYIFMAWCLVKDRHNFIFTFTDDVALKRLVIRQSLKYL
jgi:hypothetical protein